MSAVDLKLGALFRFPKCGAIKFVLCKTFLWIQQKTVTKQMKMDMNSATETSTYVELEVPQISAEFS